MVLLQSKVSHVGGLKEPIFSLSGIGNETTAYVKICNNGMQNLFGIGTKEWNTCL